MGGEPPEGAGRQAKGMHSPPVQLCTAKHRGKHAATTLPIQHCIAAAAFIGAHIPHCLLRRFQRCTPLALLQVLVQVQVLASHGAASGAQLWSMQCTNDAPDSTLQALTQERKNARTHERTHA